MDHTDEPNTPIMLASLETTHLNIIHHIRNPLFAPCLHINSIIRILWMMFSITKSMAMAFSGPSHKFALRLPGPLLLWEAALPLSWMVLIAGEWMLMSQKNMVMIGNETHPPHDPHVFFRRPVVFYKQRASEQMPK